MMNIFIAHNYDELVERCKAKVAQRLHRGATEDQLGNGVPMLLNQLQRTLVAEEGDDVAQSLRISGASGGDVLHDSEIGVSAVAHGKELMRLGFTVDQVVHDYGDICQAVTDLAVERDAPFGIAEFRTLNRCLDNAIAGAVTEFNVQRDASLARERDVAVEQRVGALAHELRNALSGATLAVAALELGSLPISGATGGVLKRAHVTMAHLIAAALEEIRGNMSGKDGRKPFALDDLIADAASACSLYAKAAGCTLLVTKVEPGFDICADRERILGALTNLLQNAFKFTAPGTQVTLDAIASADAATIEVSDHCGGLSAGQSERMFVPFTQRNADRSGLGLGLSIARKSVEADGGTLSVRNVPGVGCVFTMSLPRHREPRKPEVGA